jgi:H+/Cl- antiporter ClcA
MYELSRLNPMWKFDVLWKTFITCGMAVFVAALCDNILHGIPISFSESALKFAKARTEISVPLSVLPGAFIIGTISGLLGAFFLGVNFRLAKIRGAIYPKKWHKLIDAFIFAFLTATTFYWLPRIFQTCVPLADEQGVLKRIKTESVFDRAENTDVSIGWCVD